MAALVDAPLAWVATFRPLPVAIGLADLAASSRGRFAPPVEATGFGFVMDDAPKLGFVCA